PALRTRCVNHKNGPNRLWSGSCCSGTLNGPCWSAPEEAIAQMRSMRTWLRLTSVAAAAALVLLTPALASASGNPSAPGQVKQQPPAGGTTAPTATGPAPNAPGGGKGALTITLHLHSLVLWGLPFGLAQSNCPLWVLNDYMLTEATGNGILHATANKTGFWFTTTFTGQ